jgi:erythromycin esterase
VHAGKLTTTRVVSVLLLAFGLLLASCGSAVHQTTSADPEVSWIQQHALRLATTDLGGSDADLAPLAHLIGSASLVGLGEETHGTHELVDVKARLVEDLIRHLGYTTFVMENNWGSSQVLDAYLNGGPGTLAAVMQQTLFGSWQTHEYEALLAWVRSWNADPTHTQKVHFLGMDCQAVSQSDFDTVTQFIQQVDPLQVAAVQSLYAPIMASSLPNPYPAYYALGAAAQQHSEVRAQQVYALLAAHQQIYTQRSSAERFAVALQNARIIVEFTTYLNGVTPRSYPPNYYQRDNFMAENVVWLHDHAAGPNPKLIIWAHDAHIGNDTNYPSPNGKNLGGDLRAHYGSSYLALGTTLYQGTYRAYNYPNGIVRTLPPSTADTYNDALGQAGLSAYMLDLRTTPSGAALNWVSGEGSAHTVILVGLGGEDLDTTAPLNPYFDLIVHIQRSTPTQHL